MGRILSCLLLLVSLPVYAWNFQGDKWSDFRTKSEKIFAECIEEDYGSHKTEPVPDEKEDNYNFFWLYSLIGRHYIGNALKEPAASENPGKAPLSVLQNLIQSHKPIWGQMNDFERVSFSRCLTSELLEYSLENNNKWYLESTNDYLLKGYGCCRHFSKLGKWILDQLEVESQVVCSRYHAFLQVFAEGRWYSVEPQVQNNRFFFHDS